MLKRILFTAVGAALALSIGAAGAYFTAQVKVAENVIKAGSVAVSAEPTQAALSIDALAPGGSQSRSLTVANTGALPCDVVITPLKIAGTTALYNALECTVTCGDAALYAGPFSAMKTSAVRMAPSTRGEIAFQVGLPEGVGNELAAQYTKVSLVIDAEQAH